MHVLTKQTGYRRVSDMIEATLAICAQCGEETRSLDSCDQCGEAALLRSEYALLRVIGHGAIGTTYAARRLEDDRQVAVKEILVRRFESTKGMQLFDREAEVLRRLEHPGIPTYHDHFVGGSGKAIGFFLVQQFVDGVTLEDESKTRTYTDEEIVAIGRELAEILAYTEGKIVHRDIKPANVMRRREDGKLFLIDFGSVRQVAHELTDGSTITGTVGFMAPEQVWGRASFATDVYGLGMTLLFLKLGSVPSDVRAENGSLEPSLNLGRLRPLLSELLAVNAEDRPSNAKRLKKSLDRALEAKERNPSRDAAKRRRSSALVLSSPGEMSLAQRAIRSVGAVVIVGILGLGLVLMFVVGGKTGGAALLILLVLGALFGTIWTPPGPK